MATAEPPATPIEPGERAQGNNVSDDNPNAGIPQDARANTGNSRNNPNPQQRVIGGNNILFQQVAGGPLRDIRERLFEALFVRLSIQYATRIPMSFRRIIETIALFQAFAALAALTYIHIELKTLSPVCLEQMKVGWPKHGILRVEVIRNPDPSYNLEQSYAKEEAIQQRRFEYAGSFYTDLDLFFAPTDQFMGDPSQDTTTEPEITSEASLLMESDQYTTEGPTLNNVGNDENFDTNGTTHNLTVDVKEPLLNVEQKDGAQIPIEGQSEEISTAESEGNYSNPFVFPDEDYIIEYASEYGFLRLSPETRTRLNITVALIVLDSSDWQCFHKFPAPFFLDHIIGYDDILMGAIKQVAENEDNKGYLRNAVTGEHYRFINSGKVGINYMNAFFVMMIFTLTVSILLRFSHHQIFMFIVEVLSVIEINFTLRFPAGQMLTVILALVGMEAIMSEFFKDSSISFYVIVLVWLCDQYDSLCSHAAATKKHWLRFFYLYHFAFYAYHYRFNGQYSGFALVTCALFTFHLMLYFYHHYELPQILRVIHLSQTDRQHRNPETQTLNVIIQNYTNRTAQNVRLGLGTQQVAAVPALVVRNGNRDETSFANFLVQNITVGGGNQHGRSVYLSVLFRNLRNALRDRRPAAATEETVTVPDNPPASEPQTPDEPRTVTPEVSVEMDIIARIDGDSDAAFVPSSIQEVTPVQEEVTPVQEEVTPVQEEVTPVQEEVTPVQVTVSLGNSSPTVDSNQPSQSTDGTSVRLRQVHSDQS